jgi:hypothetical protein
MLLMYPEVWYSTRPIGNSSRSNPLARRTIARSDPSGVHSASRTCSMSGRGAPPSIEARARMPSPIHPSNAWPSETAISPDRDTDSTCASGMLRRTVSVLSVRVRKVRIGSPSQVAP